LLASSLPLSLIVLSVVAINSCFPQYSLIATLFDGI
jgi:hypothetical protein